MAAPKPRGKARRALAAVGRAIVRGGKAVAYGAKVATGRQLTKRQMELARGTERSKKIGPLYLGNRGSSISVPGYLREKEFFESPGGGFQAIINSNNNPSGWNVRKYRHEVRDYTPEGKLKRRQVVKFSRPTRITPRGTQKPGITIEYDPHGRLVGRRVRKK